MNKKELKYGDDVRKAIQSGINKLADAVKVTLGPRGKYVILDRPLGLPVVTNDGVTIAKEINLVDEFENIGAQLVKEVAVKTNDSSGDGTTTATVLVQKIINEGLRNIAAGANSTLMIRDIIKAKDKVIEELKKLANPIDTDDEVKQIATIAANDEFLGGIIAQAIHRVTKQGVVTIDEGRDAETTIDIVEGMRFDRGLVVPYFITNPGKYQAEYKDVRVLLLDEHISSLRPNDPLVNILQQLWGEQKPVLIVAKEFDGQALQSVIANRLERGLKVMVVKAPHYGDRRQESMEDIAIMTGATVISSERGMGIENLDMSKLGFANKVISTRDDTTLVVKEPDKEKLDNRIAIVKEQLDQVDNNYDKEWLEKRLAQLAGGVAVIYIGAPTEADLRAKRYKAEDALNATKSAIEMGIVPGGGYALYKCSQGLDSSIVGEQIVKTACVEPLKMIVSNAGQNGDVVLSKVHELDMLYNADTGTYENIHTTKVIDPVKVCINALENAVSSAKLLLHTETLVTIKDKVEKDLSGGKKK